MSNFFKMVKTQVKVNNGTSQSTLKTLKAQSILKPVFTKYQITFL